MFAGSADFPGSDCWVNCAREHRAYTWRILENETSKDEYMYVVIVEFKPGVRLRFAQGLCTIVLVYAGHFRMMNPKLP
jgi:hypothetical protein